MSKAPEPIGAATWQARIAEKFDSISDYLIPILQYVQGEEGWLSAQAMAAVARHLRLPPSKVYGVASFYAQFHFTPQGRNKLTVCRGTACHVRGSGPLLREMEHSLGIEAGETTEDMSFTLETVACFGACALAPVVVLNNVVHRQQTTASLKSLVAHTKNQTLCVAGDDAGIVAAAEPGKTTAKENHVADAG